MLKKPMQQGTDRAYLEKILSPDFFPESPNELFGLRAVIPCLAKQGGFNVAIVGNEVNVYLTLCFMRNNDTEPAYVIDAKKRGQDFFGIPCIDIDGFSEIAFENSDGGGMDIGWFCSRCPRPIMKNRAD
jgi:hypothetical protein